MREFIVEEKDGVEVRGHYVTSYVEHEEIVRCKDCKHRAGANVQAVISDLCMWLNIIVKPDGFCAWGERAWVTCECGEELEAFGRVQTCPSCGRKVMA